MGVLTHGKCITSARVGNMDVCLAGETQVRTTIINFLRNFRTFLPYVTLYLMTRTAKFISLMLIFILFLTACSHGSGIEDIAEPVSDTEIPPAHSSATAPPLPTPTPTPEPQELVHLGDDALFVGDYNAAYQFFQRTLTQTNDPLIQVESQLGMGRALFLQDQFGLALDQFRKAAQSMDPAVASRANYMMGVTYTQLQRYDDALNAYQAYLEAQPGLLDSRIHMLRGDLLTKLGVYQEAITEYEESYRTHPSGGTDALAVQIAVAYETAGQVDTALLLYQNILDTTSNDYIKAQMDLLIGQIYLKRDEPDLAYLYLQDAVDSVPYAYDAYTALVILVEAGVEVNEYQRGLINYYVGNYALAIEAFDRHLASGAESSSDAALYYKALAVRSLKSGDPETQSQNAIALWEQLIIDYPGSAYLIDAWEDVEFTLWAYLGKPQQAAERALEFVAQRYDSPQAPDFLFLAGRSYERAGMLREAADTWSRIADEYPSSEQTFRGVFFAGITLVRLGDWAGARTQFDRALVLGTEPDQLAAAYFWIGKCQEAEGDISAALDTWKQAQLADPFGHYSIRAEDLLIGRPLFSAPLSYTLDPDLTPYRLEAEAWLCQTFNQPLDTNLESPGLLAHDPRFRRGSELWALGEYEAAKSEFESMRAEFSTDPAQTFRLIPSLVDLGLYRSALVASTELLKLAGLEGAAALEAPEFFSRIRFGAYYLDWLLPIADDEGFSPLLVLSIIRQESAYEGFIRSTASARGLMQIMPDTGAQLADQLAWPEDYTIDDLNRPYVSLVFGTHYLRQQLNLFNGDLFAMLAAYNGGPGNTIAWKGFIESGDPDLFLEVIRIEETRNYIRLINEIYYIYRWLYGTPEER